MNQTTLIIVLGTMVAALVVACGILLALQRKNKGVTATSSVPEQTTSPPSTARKRDVQNDEYIESAQEELKAIESLLTACLVKELTQVMPSLRDQLSQHLKQGKEENFLEIYAYAISFAKAGDIRTEIERRCCVTMEAIFDSYQQELLPATFNSVPGAAALKTRYKPTQTIRAREALNGQAALKRNLSPLYCELDELARLQQRLASYLPQLEEMKHRGHNWAGAARGFATGALAAVHPLFGIPMLIANWCNDSNNQKREDAFAKTAMNEFSDYIGRWERLPNIYLPACEDQRLLIIEKMSQIFDVTLPRILSDLDKAGFCLKRVCPVETFLNGYLFGTSKVA